VPRPIAVFCHLYPRAPKPTSEQTFFSFSTKGTLTRSAVHKHKHNRNQEPHERGTTALSFDIRCWNPPGPDSHGQCASIVRCVRVASSSLSTAVSTRHSIASFRLRLIGIHQSRPPFHQPRLVLVTRTMSSPPTRRGTPLCPRGNPGPFLRCLRQDTAIGTIDIQCGPGRTGTISCRILSPYL